MWKKTKTWIKNYLLSHKRYQFIVRDWIALTDLQPAQDMMATMRFSQNLQPIVQTIPTAKRILAIAPHPDDVTLGAGGTLLKAMAQGAEVLTVYLTSGRSVSAERKHEAEQVALAFGHRIVFFDYIAEAIPIHPESMARLAAVINDFSPEVVFLPFCLDDHDDHRRASHLLLAVYRHHLLQSSFEIWAYQVYSVLLPNVIVDITEVADRKAHIITLWKSQCQKRNWPHYILGLNAFNQRFLPNDSKARYAETFFVLPLKAYMDYCGCYFDPNATQCYYTAREYTGCYDG